MSVCCRRLPSSEPVGIGLGLHFKERRLVAVLWTHQRNTFHSIPIPKTGVWTSVPEAARLSTASQQVLFTLMENPND